MALPLGFAAGMAVKVCLLAVVLRYRIGRLGDSAGDAAEVHPS